MEEKKGKCLIMYTVLRVPVLSGAGLYGII